MEIGLVTNDVVDPPTSIADEELAAGEKTREEDDEREA